MSNYNKYNTPHTMKITTEIVKSRRREGEEYIEERIEQPLILRVDEIKGFAFNYDLEKEQAYATLFFGNNAVEVLGDPEKHVDRWIRKLNRYERLKNAKRGLVYRHRSRTY